MRTDRHVDGIYFCHHLPRVMGTRVGCVWCPATLGPADITVGQAISIFTWRTNIDAARSKVIVDGDTGKFRAIVCYKIPVVFA